MRIYKMPITYSPSVASLITEVIVGKYVDRGDPVDDDFTLIDIIADDAWHDLDLSGIVAPAGANHLVHLVVIIKATKSDNRLIFREKGNINAVNSLLIRTQAANIFADKDAFTLLDSSRVIEYKASPNEWVSMSIAVRGWVED